MTTRQRQTTKPASPNRRLSPRTAAPRTASPRARTGLGGANQAVQALAKPNTYINVGGIMSAYDKFGANEAINKAIKNSKYPKKAARTIAIINVEGVDVGSSNQESFDVFVDSYNLDQGYKQDFALAKAALDREVQAKKAASPNKVAEPRDDIAIFLEAYKAAKAYNAANNADFKFVDVSDINADGKGYRTRSVKNLDGGKVYLGFDLRKVPVKSNDHAHYLMAMELLDETRKAHKDNNTDFVALADQYFAQRGNQKVVGKRSPNGTRAEQPPKQPKGEESDADYFAKVYKRVSTGLTAKGTATTNHKHRFLDVSKLLPNGRKSQAEAGPTDIYTQIPETNLISNNLKSAKLALGLLADSQLYGYLYNDRYDAIIAQYIAENPEDERKGVFGPQNRKASPKANVVARVSPQAGRVAAARASRSPAQQSAARSRSPSPSTMRDRQRTRAQRQGSF